MNIQNKIKLKNFFIFNSRLGPKEGEELQKILFYYPITDNADVQIKNVGLVEGIILFTENFKPSNAVSSLHTQKTRQLYYQPEKEFWLVMTLTLDSKKEASSENQDDIEYEIQDNIYEAVLQQAYLMYRLFSGTFESCIQAESVGALKTKLEHFYNAYLKSLKLNHSDILNIFSGIQYLPLDKLTFLKVQCMINMLECNYPIIKYTAFLHNDHLIWSGIEPNDMKLIYQYLIGTLLYHAKVETELQGGSMPRNPLSPFALHHGRFLTGPTNLKNTKTIGKIPKVHLFFDGKPSVYYLVVYRALSASICLFTEADKELELSFFEEIDKFLSPKLTNLVSDMAEYCSKQVVTPSSANPETSPKFIYFNKINLAYKSTVHLDTQQTGNVTCPRESLKIMADLHEKRSQLGHSSEIIVKTMNDYWVVAKTSNMREFYIALQEKNANLLDISEEVEKFCETGLKGIFFHNL